MASLLMCILLAGAIFAWSLRRRIPKGLRLPPGPPPKPIIGNALDMPTSQEWDTYSKWAKQYGEIVFIEVLGSRLIFLNSRRLVYELFDKRSSNYSSRPLSTMISLVKFDWLTSLLPYGDTWRRSRSIIHQQFHPAAVERYKPIQLKHTRALLYRILTSPEKYAQHLRHATGAITMEVAYGIMVKDQDDPYIQLAEAAMHGGESAAKPGAFWVDFLPPLKWVPEWFPGADFKRKAKEWRILWIDMANVPFEAVKKAMASGTAQPSFTASSLERLAARKDAPYDEEDIIRYAAGTLYGGGTGTTVGVLKSFVLAMLLYPEAQRKAQKELDDAIQELRLVEYSDRDYLPYTVALMKEVLRWLPLTPIALPHMTMKDDEFEGYFIPAGSTVIGNTWHLSRDEADYGADTDKFIPERFLRPGARDPGFVFGYGRRVCSGRNMAEHTLFIVIASMLQVFDILPPTDSTGKEQPLEYEWPTGLFMHPENLKCRILPRSSDAEQLVMQWHNSLQ